MNREIVAGCTAMLLKGEQNAGKIVTVVRLLCSNPRVWEVESDLPVPEGRSGWKAPEKVLMRIDGFDDSSEKHETNQTRIAETV